MAVLDILLYPDPILRQTSSFVDLKDTALPKLVEDMFETLRASNGIGLAAPQIGVLKRVIVIDFGRETEVSPLALINPEILWRSEETTPFRNGCLSLPGIWADVVRPAAIEIKYYDENFQPQLLKTDGLLAVCAQHEIDHLNGKIFIDHLSKLKRDFLIKKFFNRKMQEQEDLITQK
ncbi:MAG: peptide deformylase [Holosporales bacterium]|jgi:peptide deformylase|nr:peptide deformylase [Holosporales bacterium]